MKKKQKLFLGFAVLVIVAIFTITGCDTGNDNKESKEVDSCLWAAGGDWGVSHTYTYKTVPWFTFTKTTMTINPGNYVPGTPVSVYTQNGGVYLLETDALILTYRQYNEDDFTEQLQQAIASGNHQVIYDVHDKMEKAKAGFFMRFTTQGVSADYCNWPGLMATGSW
jgi:hypothetical protein